jgi:hypothetical protein
MPRCFGEQPHAEFGHLLEEHIIEFTENPRILDHMSHKYFGEFMALSNANSVGSMNRTLHKLTTVYTTNRMHCNMMDGVGFLHVDFDIYDSCFY